MSSKSISNNPLVAGLVFRQGTCADSTVFKQFQAVKLDGDNHFVPCTTADTDSVVAGVALVDRNPGDPTSLPICTDFLAHACPVLTDGSATATPGNASTGFLTLSATSAGRFKPSTSGILRCVTGADATADTVLLASFVGGGAGGGSSPSVVNDSISGGAFSLDGTILNALHVVALTASGTLAIASPVAGETYQLKIVQSGGFTITWNAAFKWPGGIAPTLSTAAGAVDFVTATYDGTNFNSVYALAFS